MEFDTCITRIGPKYNLLQNSFHHIIFSLAATMYCFKHHHRDLCTLLPKKNVIFLAVFFLPQDRNLRFINL